MTARRSSLATLTGCTSATRAASSRRRSTTSVMTTRRAPTWRATAAAMMPIGPAPVISTSSPRDRERQRRVHGVAERIQQRADLVVDGVGQRHDVERGQRQQLGERARQRHADALGVGIVVETPGARGAAAHAGDVTFARHPLARPKVPDVGAHSDDLARVFVADDQRHGHCALGPVVPAPDVQIRSTNTRFCDADHGVIGS